MTPVHEHEKKATLSEDVFYPDHAARTESPTFRHTKRTMKESGEYRCAVCGTDEKIEDHHRFIEWAFADAIDWYWIKMVATGQCDTVWSHTMQKEVKLSKLHVIYDFLKLTADFDWLKFEPSKPETFVDSPANMWPLCELHHRAANHGIHAESFPIWFAQAFLKKGFIYSPDEMKGRHEHGS
jgi:hypothetical protein